MRSQTQQNRLPAARFNSYYSRCAETDNVAVNYFNLLIRFLKGTYLDILTRYSHHIVYVSGGIKDFVPSLDLTYKAGNAPTDDQVVRWTKQIQSLDFYGFDEITALSEEGINLMFASLWNDATHRNSDNLLASLAIDHFNASFGAPTVRLLSSGKAIVWITVKRGEIVVVK